jgi:phage gp45-like
MSGTWWHNLLRRARLRGLVEGEVQRVRAEALDDDAKDDAERWQDYGFAANVVDGQGLVINVGGHTIVLRMDRIAERPALAAYEVAVWHREGHRVTLKAGQLVQVDCAELIVNAGTRVRFNTPVVEASAEITAPTVAASSSLTVQGKEMHLHTHGGVDTGIGTSGPPT